PLRRHAARSRLAAVRLRPELWPGGISAHAGHAQGPWLGTGALHPARRPPDVAGDRGGAGPGRQRVVSRPVPAIRGLSRWRESGGQLRDAAGLAGDRLRGQERSVCGDEGAGVNTKLWVRWFSAVSLILVLWGVAFALFGLGILPVERKVLLEWESAIYGAIMMGWGTTLFFVGRIALRRRDAELTRPLLAGIAVWLVVEAAFSAYYGVWFNVGVDAGVLVLFSVPLIVSMRAANGKQGSAR